MANDGELDRLLGECLDGGLPARRGCALGEAVGGLRTGAAGVFRDVDLGEGWRADALVSSDRFRTLCPGAPGLGLSAPPAPVALVRMTPATRGAAAEHRPLAVSVSRMAAAGFAPEYAALLYVNSDYVRRGPVDPRALFRCHDPATLAKDNAFIRAFVAASGGGGAPAGRVESYYQDELARLPAPVSPEGLRQWARPLAEPDAEESYPAPEIPTRYEIADRPSLSRFLGGLRFPIRFLDFETFALTVPPYDGTWPNATVPFQYSLHRLGAPDAAPAHAEYLHAGADNPIPPLLERLRGDLGETGTILVWTDYECQVLDQAVRSRACANADAPEDSDDGRWLQSLGMRWDPKREKFVPGGGRIVDLAEPFQSGWLRHPDSARYSIKHVYPLLVGKSYSDLAIQDGLDASDRFLRLYHGDAAGPDGDATRRELLAYCRRDTEAMIETLACMRRLA